MSDPPSSPPGQMTRDELLSIIDSIERDVPRERQSVLNCRAALDRLEQDSELFQDLLGFFFSDTPKLMTDLKRAVESRNQDLLRRASHSLKGLISNFDAKDASATALRLENMGRDGDLTEASSAYEQLEHELDEVEQLLRRFRVHQPSAR